MLIATVVGLCCIHPVHRRAGSPSVVFYHRIAGPLSVYFNRHLVATFANSFVGATECGDFDHCGQTNCETFSGALLGPIDI